MPSQETVLRSYGAVSSRLSALDDQQLGALLRRASPLGVGIGGTCSLLDVDGVRVFVKQVPLTDLELEHPMSTANLFDLPPFLQYGIGSAGFGAWRELAAHKMTTEWVLDGSHGGFPVMYHWRVLPGATPSADPEDLIGYWGGSPPVRARFEALRHPSAGLVLFLQYVPHTVHDWFHARLTEGDQAIDAACAMVDRELRTGTEFMGSRGLLHFDAHFANILTDGEHLYFADFGLAASTEFDLSPAEREFFEQHESYDRCYTKTHLLMSLARVDGPLPTATAAVVERHTPVAEVMRVFLHDLRKKSRTTPYPAATLTRLTT
jgi:hypothetical protein